MAYSDKVLICRDCGASFTFTAGEQSFYSSRGLLNLPTRCPSCRSVRKSGRAVEEGGYVHYGAAARVGGRTPRQMHPAVCAECGQMTEVPFLPRGDKPVYCSECYNKIRDRS